MSGIRVNEWLHNSGTGGIWQSSAGNVGIASSVPTAKLVVTGDTNVSGAVTATAFVPSVGQLSHRNLIINGAMQVAQRGTSSTTSGYGTVDRYKVEFSGHDEAMTQAQGTVAAGTDPYKLGFRKTMKVTNGNQTSGAGAADFARILYNIEAQDVANSGWEYTNTASKLTISYWVKSSVAQNFYNYLRTPDGTVQGYSFQTGALTADTWTKITHTISGGSNITINDDNGNGINISFALFFGTDYTDSGNTMNAWAAYASGSRMPDNTSTWYTTNDATYELTGLQFEVGSVATPFEHRSYADELQRCKRYFQRLNTASSGEKELCMGLYETGSTVNSTIWFHPEMRTTPTGSVGSGTDWYHIRRDGSNDTFNDFALFSATKTSAMFRTTSNVSGTGGQAGLIRTLNVGATLDVSAEL